MPHLGQSPGVADSTPGHIGQKNFAPDEGWIASEESCSWPPQQDLAFTGSGSGSGRGESQQELISFLQSQTRGESRLVAREKTPPDVKV